MADPFDEITLAGQTCLIMVDAPFRYGNDRQGSSRTITYLTPQGAGAKVCDYLLGIGAYRSPLGWPIPHRYKNNENLICERAEGLEWGALGPGEFGIEGDYSRIVADYTTPFYDVTGEAYQAVFDGVAVPWSDLSAEEGHEEYTVRLEGLTDAATGEALEKTIKRRVGVTEYVYRRMMIPTLDLLVYRDILRPLREKLNDRPFMNCPRGTVLFQNFRWTNSRDSAGNLVHEFEMTLREREKDWNMVPGTKLFDGWITPSDTSGNSQNYKYADFRPLINYGVVA